MRKFRLSDTPRWRILHAACTSQQALRWSSFFAWSSSHSRVAALGICWRTARAEGCKYPEQIRIELTFASNDLMAEERLRGWPYPRCVGDRIIGNGIAVYEDLIAFSFTSSLVLALVGSRVIIPSNRWDSPISSVPNHSRELPLQSLPSF